MFVTLKALKERKVSIDQVINRLRPKTSHVPGATLFFQAAQDLQIGGRFANAQYQYTLSGENLEELYEWAPKLMDKLRAIPMLKDVSSDQQVRGLQQNVIIDRDTAARLGITPSQIDNVLYDAFGQRQISTIYQTLNQYHVVLEVDPAIPDDALTRWRAFTSSPRRRQCQQTSRKRPGSIAGITEPPLFGAATSSAGQASTAPSGKPSQRSAGAQVPLSSFAHFGPSSTSLTVDHQGQFPAVTISFNLAPGASLGRRHPRHRADRDGHADAGHDSRQLPGNGRGIPGFALVRAAADSDRAALPCTSCSACCTRATSIPSRFCRPYLPPAPARSWV